MSDTSHIRKSFQKIGAIIFFLWIAAAIFMSVFLGLSFPVGFILVSGVALAYVGGISLMIQYIKECQRVIEAEVVYGGQIIR